MADLAQRLGTSITPVREACLRLVSEQALELQSGRFVKVPTLTRSRYWQIRLIRLVLEGLAAELAAENADAADIDRLADIHRAFVKAEATGLPEDARRLNQEFHFGVYNLCRFPMLINQIASMWVAMGPIFNIYYGEPPDGYAGADEHLNLIEALKRGDKTAARKAIENDIQRGGVVILRYFDKVGDTIQRSGTDTGGPDAAAKQGTSDLATVVDALR